MTARQQSPIAEQHPARDRRVATEHDGPEVHVFSEAGLQGLEREGPGTIDRTVGVSVELKQQATRGCSEPREDDRAFVIGSRSLAGAHERHGCPLRSDEVGAARHGGHDARANRSRLHLLALRQATGLQHYAFWHVASHAFFDSITGRLSGIALADQDMWLDQMRDLAPLPELITLSACSGLQNLMFEGDEAIGLTTTCLAAGARQVIGNLWPIRDEAAARLMADVYRHFLTGESAARALALAQRAAAQRHEDPLNWGSGLCIGAP